jgi:hypothetical protein
MLRSQFNRTPCRNPRPAGSAANQSFTVATLRAGRRHSVFRFSRHAIELARETEDLARYREIAAQAPEKEKIKDDGDDAQNNQVLQKFSYS